MLLTAIRCRESPEHSFLSKASLVDGFNFPSAIAVTIVEGISLLHLELVKETITHVQQAYLD